MTAHRLRLIEGRPWREAVICAMASDAPYRPWYGIEEVERGDVAIVVIDTDPRTVLCTLTIGSKRDVANAIAHECRYGSRTLLTIDDVEEAAGGFSLIESAGLPIDSAAAVALTEAVGDYSVSTPADRVGFSSVAAGRILLHSEGLCTCCGEEIDLADNPEELPVHLVSAADFQSGRDCPAVVCPTCTAAMTTGGFSSVVDYEFSLQPSCPRCSARRTRTVSYGMPSYSGAVNTPPWRAGGGCVVGSSGRWSCGKCGHEWG